MKKILSFLAFSGITTSISFNVVSLLKKRLDLKKLNVFNVNVFAEDNISRNLQINVVNTFNLIVYKIMHFYNHTHYKNAFKLKVTDFSYGNKVDGNHPWAIEIMNIDGKTAFTYDLKKQNQALIFPSDYTVLPNNALKVKIRTNNNNIKEKLTIINAFLNKYICTKQNLNNNHDLNIFETNGINALSTPGNVIDISQTSSIQHPWKLDANSDSFQIALQFFELSKAKRRKIWTKILTNLNKQLSKETRTLNHLGILPITSKLEKNFFQSTIDVISVTNNTIRKLDLYENLPIQQGVKIYVGIFNLRIPNYIFTPNSCLYLYLGTTTKVTS